MKKKMKILDESQIQLPSSQKSFERVGYFRAVTPKATTVAVKKKCVDETI